MLLPTLWLNGVSCNCPHIVWLGVDCCNNERLCTFLPFFLICKRVVVIWTLRIVTNMFYQYRHQSDIATEERNIFNCMCIMMTSSNGDKWRYWPFVRGIHRSAVNSLPKGQWGGALMFSLIWAWINGWVNNGKASDLRRHRTYCDVTLVARHKFMCCSVVK